MLYLLKSTFNQSLLDEFLFVTLVAWSIDNLLRNCCRLTLLILTVFLHSPFDYSKIITLIFTSTHFAFILMHKDQATTF